MRISDHDAVTVRFGDSLDDVVNYLRTTPRVWNLNESRMGSVSNYQWTFGVGYEQALELALAGWPDGTDRLAEGIKAMPAPTATHHKRMHDVGGDFPDVGRFVSGMSDCMVRRGRFTGQKPVIHMVMNVSVSWHITAYQFMTMGTALALVIDKLEASGRRVELDTVFYQTLPYKPSLEGWKIKRADEHLDFSALAFSLAHPASPRRIAFGLRERTLLSQQARNYGVPASMPKQCLALIDAENALLINAKYSDCDTTRGAVRSLTRIINAAAGETIVEADYD